MTTKERIVEASLTLFSTKGYQGTTVKNIAEVVGIKDSSLYKHFASKKEIFDTIMWEMDRKLENMSAAYGLPPEEDMDGAVLMYGNISEDTLLELSKKIFLFYLKDDFVSRIRRMLAMEQYRSREIYEVYKGIFFEGAIRYQSRLFEEMLRQGVFKGGSPDTMAVNFYAPIYFLLSRYDQEPEKEEEALNRLEAQVREFSRIYRA